MTEREKMLSGELYDSSDNELEQLRLHARKLARRYNLTDEDQQEVQTQILRELLPATEELPYLQAPVYFDYGCHTYFGIHIIISYGILVRYHRNIQGIIQSVIYLEGILIVAGHSQRQQILTTL